MKLEVTPVKDIEAFEKRLYTDTPQPCLLLRAELNEATLVNLVKNFIVFHIEHEGKWRDVLLFGVWRPETVIELDEQERMDALTEREGNWDFIDEHPDATGVLLSASLTAKQREAVRTMFEIEEVEIDGVAREQIKVAWFTPKFRKIGD